ncbi:NUDIX domain-containing protein [Candidatus Woesearchaeota archaeon]|nr:NUDIX domain-containing protein [Candidatus Woesearchaeota archaeon]
MKTYLVVTGIVKFKNKVLILKKSPNDYNYPNRWSFCSGYIKEFESAEDSVLREIKEETGLKAQIVKKGKLFQRTDKNKSWVIVPFLCRTKAKDVKLDHENVEFRWINFNDIKNYQTVPGLEKDLKVLGLQ